MNKKKLKNFRVQYFVRHECEKKPEYSFGVGFPDLQKVSLAKLIKFSETVINVREPLGGEEVHVTIGMKLVNTKSKRFYGTYVKFSQKTLEKYVHEGVLAAKLVTGARDSHAALEKNLYKYKLVDGEFPKPFKTV